MPSGSRLLPDRESHVFEDQEHEPPWAVFVHNDDVTPMDFVVHILVTVFELPQPNASQVMFAAHLNGRAYVQTLPRNEARRRVGHARFAARMRGFPLDFSLEEQ